MKQLRVRNLSLLSLVLLVWPAVVGRAQTEAVAAWQVTRFDLTATLPAAGASERTLAVRATLTARNVGQGTGRTFTVRLHPAAEVKSVAAGDAATTFVKRDDAKTQTQVVTVALPTAYPAGSAASVTLDYTLPLSAPNAPLAAIAPDGAQFLPLAFWYPAPNTPYAVRGADYAPVRLTVNAPAGQSVVASGAASGATYEQKLAAQPFFLTGRWDTVEGTGAARGISAYLPTGAGADEQRQAAALAGVAAAARAFYANMLGPAPDVPVRLVAVRRGAGFDMAGTVLLDAAAFRRTKVDAVSVLSIAQGMAHLWLGAATPVRGEGAGVLREGLARYLATLFLDKQYGRDAAEAERLRERLAYAPIAGRDGALALTTPLDQTYYNATANKGAMVWRLVERSLGRDVFQEILRAQLQAGRESELSLAVLRAALGGRGGERVQALLTAQLDQPTDTDLLVGLPQQRPGEWVSALRNTGAVEVAVPVAATTDTGARLIADVTIPAHDFGEAHFKSPARLVRVEVDPDKLYPQTDYANDTAPRAPALDAALADASRALGAGDYAKAEATARTMLQAAPLMQEARILLARALLEQTKLADAEREFRAALDDKLPLPATLAWGAVGLAQIAARKGQATEAVRLFTEAVRAEGGYPPTLAARTGRLAVAAAPGLSAPAVDEAVKTFVGQLDQAIRGGRKADLEALLVPGELQAFGRGFIALRPDVWQTRVLRTEAVDADRIAADVAITVKAENRDRNITAVLLLTRAGGALRLAEIPIFEER